MNKVQDKFQDLVSEIKEQNRIIKEQNEKMKEDKAGKRILWILAIIGAVAAIAGIAYAVYRYLTPDYLEDFDDDDYEDDFDDYFEDEDSKIVPLKKEETDEAPEKEEETP